MLNKKHIRNDLEFYIPQLCTFMLFGEYETVEEFLAFLCKACFASFSFAHRIVWFLKSLINPYNPHNERIRTILHLIQTIFKSENKTQLLERLHVAGSKKFIEYLQKSKMIAIYDPNPKNIDSEDSKIIKKRQIRETLDNYIDKQYNDILRDEEEKDSLGLDFSLTKQKIIDPSKNEPDLKSQSDSLQEQKIDSVDVFINTFKRYDSVTNDENNINVQYVKQIDMDDINLSSFLSNINFVDHLCNICEILRSTALSNQNKTLLNELRKVNKILPANIYIPFLKDSIRNYVIASVPLSEVKIFRTKNRAPYLITFECFRLDELTFNILNEKEKDRVNTSSSNSSSNDENDILKNPISLNKSKKKKTPSVIRDDFGQKKNNPFKSSLLQEEEKLGVIEDKTETEDKEINKSEEVVEHLNKGDKNDFYVAIKDKKIKSFLEPSNAVNNNLTTRNKQDNKPNKFNYLLETDVNLSKPVVIKDILNANTIKAPKNIKIKRRIFDVDYDTDPEDYMKIEKVVKNNINEDKHRLSMNLTEEPKEINSSAFENEISQRLKPKDSKLVKKEKEDANKNKLLDNEEIPGLISQEETENAENPEEIILTPHKREFDKDVIFGEKIEDQTERLKKSSPFGFLNTYKLFKIIVKSGEDLRQEQFATQLINEFHQIFKIEKVDCWVNPYEIIATGNNVGIIEVVPNSISIDQLKRKTKYISSLRNFYETYYAPIGSVRYKKAMKNFISSLAGYSLVCYFLQIKDRHNANILIDDQGRIIHIDFGFMLSNAPGKGIQFEKAPFKLTKEFVDVMGGVNSKYFTKFRKLLWKGFIAVINNYEKILILVEMMYCGHGNKLPCFEKGQIAINELRSRFIPRPNMKTRDYIQHVDSLIEQSIDNWRTKWYDKYQYWVQGIFY